MDSVFDYLMEIGRKIEKEQEDFHLKLEKFKTQVIKKSLSVRLEELMILMVDVSLILTMITMYKRKLRRYVDQESKFAYSKLVEKSCAELNEESVALRGISYNLCEVSQGIRELLKSEV